MINIQDLTLLQGSQLLIDHAEVFIAAQQKVGIIGANGSGKTSFLNAILGHLEPQTGQINLPNGLIIAHVEQTLPSLEETALLYVMRAQPRCHIAYSNLLTAE